MPSKKPNADPEWWLTIDALGEFLGRKRPALDALRRRFGNQFEKRIGRGAAARVLIDMRRWLPLYIKHLRRRRPRSRQSERLLRVRADREEFRLARERGQLVTPEEATAAIAEYVDMIRVAHRNLCDECKTAVTKTLDAYRADLEARFPPHSVEANGKVHRGLQTKRAAQRKA